MTLPAELTHSDGATDPSSPAQSWWRGSGWSPQALLLWFVVALVTFW